MRPKIIITNKRSNRKDLKLLNQNIKSKSGPRTELKGNNYFLLKRNDLNHSFAIPLI